MNLLIKGILLAVAAGAVIVFFISAGTSLTPASPVAPEAPETADPAPQDATSVEPSTQELEMPTKNAAEETNDAVEAAETGGLEKTLQETLDALTTLRDAGLARDPEPIANLNETVRASVVNILCTTRGAGPLSPVSASGVIIHPSGIILTNAHVAQFFLLKDYPSPGFVECIIRTGSPARPAYTADLLFISPSWIAANAEKVDDTKPTGSGEHDWALLMVAGFVAAPGVPAPAEFAALPIARAAPDLSDSVLLAGYPAGFLGGITIQKELYAVSSNAMVEKLYTFGTNTADLFSIGGSVVAQQGASGGAVARADGALVGIITTSSDAETTGERDLRALSTEYIIRDFESEAGVPLADYLSADLNQQRQLFESAIAPALAQQLVEVLER